MRNTINRVVDGVFQTPLCEFDHPATGSSIGFAGMVHIGDPQYFDVVEDYVTRREVAGSLVHYERMMPPTAEELVESGLDPALVERFGTGVEGTFNFLGKRLGLRFQLDSMQYGEAWENHDIPRLELMRLLGAKGVERFTEKGEKLVDLEDKIGSDLTLKIMSGTLRHISLVSMLSKLSPKNRREDRIVTDRRNEVALLAIDEALRREPERDITLLWGAMHLPGIGKGLRQRGYKLNSTQWLNAFTLPAKVRK